MRKAALFALPIFLAMTSMVGAEPLPQTEVGAPLRPRRDAKPALNLEAVSSLSRLLTERVASQSAMKIVTTACGSAPTLSCDTTTNANPSCLGDQYYIDLYIFNATAGQTLSIRATTSTGYQELVTIQDYSSGAIITSNYGPSPVTLTYTFPSTGRYVIAFAFVAKFTTGAYSLALTCGTAPPPSGTCQVAGTLTRGAPVSGSLGPADTACANNKVDYYKLYQFTAIAGVPIRINLSASFPKYINVSSDGSATEVVQYSSPPEPYLIFYPVTTGRQVLYVGQDQERATSGSFTISIEDLPSNPCGSPTPPPPTSGSCQANSQTMCLAGSRFAVSVAWKTPDGKAGAGIQNTLTSDSGYFWFFQSSNVELVVKVLDARVVNGKFWVFYGALSDVEYTITVRDTVTGAIKTYRNPAKNLASVADIFAF